MGLIPLIFGEFRRPFRTCGCVTGIAESAEDSNNWNRLVELYAPLLRVWLRKYDVQTSDADDLVQEVLMAVSKEPKSFDHSGRPGAFRSWLQTILTRRLRNFWRAQGRRPQARGDSDIERRLELLEDPASELSEILPNENEWYKAAYHKNDEITGNYWDHPTSTDEVPYSDQPPGSDAPNQSNTANFFKDYSAENNDDDGVAVTASPSFDANVNMLTDVGALTQSVRPYGTFDQGGYVSEWNESRFTRQVTRGGKREVVARHGARGFVYISVQVR